MSVSKMMEDVWQWKDEVAEDEEHDPTGAYRLLPPSEQRFADKTGGGSWTCPDACRRGATPRRAARSGLTLAPARDNLCGPMKPWKKCAAGKTQSPAKPNTCRSRNTTYYRGAEPRLADKTGGKTLDLPPANPTAAAESRRNVKI